MSEREKEREEDLILREERDERKQIKASVRHCFKYKQNKYLGRKRHLR